MAGCELGAGTFINDTLPEEKAAELRKYTEALLSAVPQLDPETKMKRIILPGEVANPADLPSGCYFHPRCNYAKKYARQILPNEGKLHRSIF